MTAAVERFLDDVRADPRSSLEMVDLIEEILTRRYLAGADDNTDNRRGEAATVRLFSVGEAESMTEAFLRRLPPEHRADFAAYKA
jgi:hypothetical protein